jgi:phosphate transport system substrate-binding protein
MVLALLLIAIAGVVLPADSTLTTNSTAVNSNRSDVVYGFGTDFSASVINDAIFQYKLDVGNTATIVYNAIPLEGIECAFNGDITGGDCAALFQVQVQRTPHDELELHDRRMLGMDAPRRDLGVLLNDDELEIDFAVSNDPMETSQEDLQNFPLFIYGIAPVFNIPGVTRLMLSKMTVAKIFRGCDDVEPACLPGSITRWNDSAILASNPTSVHSYLQAAGEIKVLIHSQAGSTTTAFKKALASFDADFDSQIGVADDNFWNGTEFASVIGGYGTLRTVHSTPSSIGFDEIHHNVIQRGVYQVELNVDRIPGRTRKADTEALFKAFAEIGLSFDIDGNLVSDLKFSLQNALGASSWPIARIAYLSLRTDHTPENCLVRKTAMLSFFEFIYNNQGEGSDLFKNGIAPLTAKAGQVREMRV